MRSKADAQPDGEAAAIHRPVLARAGRNFGWLAASMGFSAIASLIYVALTARTLGPAGFGSFALVMTYGELISNFAQFQSWKAVTSFGAAHQQANDGPRLSRLFGYALSIDMLGGLLGSVVAALGIPLAGALLHWTSMEESTALWFGAVLLLTSSTAPAGMLRLLGRFDLQAVSEAIAQVTRFVGCLVGWVAGRGVVWFLGVWALAASLQLMTQWLAVLALGHRPSLALRSLGRAHEENPGLWRFMLNTNVSNTLSLVWMQFGTLLVGTRAGAAEAGGFRLAYRFSIAMTKPAEMGAKALCPELARLVADDAHGTLRKVFVRVSCIATALAAIAVLAAILWGRSILGLVAGAHFEFAHRFLVLLCIASAISVAGFAFEPLLNAHFRAGTVLRNYAITALTYLVLAVLLLPRFGASAAAFAAIAASLSTYVLMGFAAARLLSQPGSSSQSEQAYRGEFDAPETPAIRL